MSKWKRRRLPCDYVNCDWPNWKSMGKYGKEGGYLATMRMPWIGKVPEFCHKFDAGCPVAVPSWHSAMWNIITGQGLIVVNDILEYCSQNIF